jgi:tRNA pseudouridine13 synthase
MSRVRHPLIWPTAWGAAVATAKQRSVPADFQVEEQLALHPLATGAQQLLEVTKVDQNTVWVAEAIAAHAGVALNAIAYCGLKDRHAQTRQWFSLPAMARAIDWSALALEGVTITPAGYLRYPLRRGDHLANRFTLTLREVAGDRQAIDTRLEQIAGHGVPNYFGPQRFGQQGGNLLLAEQLFAGERLSRHLRSLALSAARSYLFNRLLALRVTANCWLKPISGDRLQPADEGLMVAWQGSSEQQAALERGDLTLVGWLCGDSSSRSRDKALAFEEQAVAGFDHWVAGLAAARLRVEWRPLRLRASELRWQWLDTTTLQIGFTLPAGGYATTLLRELLREVY